MVLQNSQRELQAPGPSKIECYDLYQSAQMEPQSIARRRKIKEGTVLGYIAECGAMGMPVDWSRLCTDAKLGPAGSEYITADEILQAVQTCKEELQLKPLNLIVETTKVRNALMRIQAAASKIQIQERLLQGSGFTHAQIKIVLAMMIQGISPNQWNSLIPRPQDSREVSAEFEKPPF